ncbi:formate dehydrogenase subunit delta [Amaricoccus sp.]|uniref:formate dehydrogenase subunit delta n=1 Tax=Amaricoccus sp. TaxID=1872485 RepID=UPI00262BF120|nr:formate dehydrogenase subunit delta [uncultured Amaricoccus sp.]
MTRIDATEELVRMTNQIADFFRAYPEEEAEHGIELHIRDFWEPRMRRALHHHLATGGDGLSDLARAGATRVFTDTAPISPPPPGCDGG